METGGLMSAELDTYGALELRALPSAILEDVFHADISTTKVLTLGPS